MKGFIVATLIIAIVIGVVFASAGVLDTKMRDIYHKVERGRYKAAAEDFDGLFPFLHLCAPDGILREVEVGFCDLITSGGEGEKSRLLVLLEDLRRQVGFYPISFF